MNGAQFGNAHRICHDIVRAAFPTYLFIRPRKKSDEIWDYDILLKTESYFPVVTIEIFLSSQYFILKYGTMTAKTKKKNWLKTQLQTR